jgi:hypothetical protein
VRIKVVETRILFIQYMRALRVRHSIRMEGKVLEEKHGGGKERW